MAHTVETSREVKITLDEPASIEGLIVELTAIRDRQSIGPDATVTAIRGGGGTFSLTLVRSD